MLVLVINNILFLILSILNRLRTNWCSNMPPLIVLLLHVLIWKVFLRLRGSYRHALISRILHRVLGLQINLRFRIFQDVFLTKNVVLIIHLFLELHHFKLTLLFRSYIFNVIFNQVNFVVWCFLSKTWFVFLSLFLLGVILQFSWNWLPCDKVSRFILV